MQHSQSRRALIFGVYGQDGSYLARLLLDKGYAVFGTSRDAETQRGLNHARLGIDGRVEMLSVSPTDFRSVFTAVTGSNPHEIYNLSGQSSVGLSFSQPVDTLESIAIGTVNILETVRLTDASIRIYNAGSSECFGDTGDVPANETTAFRPRSPYGVAKSAAFWQIANYREAYGLHCSSGILFNHESPLRPERFVTRKIVSAAVRIAAGSDEKLSLGALEIERDWGWAPEYVDAMWRMLQQDEADDYVIATGSSRSLEDFVKAAFAGLELDWEDHVTIDDTLLRPLDIRISRGDADKARRRLDWCANVQFDTIVERLIEAERVQHGRES